MLFLSCTRRSPPLPIFNQTGGGCKPSRCIPRAWVSWRVQRSTGSWCARPGPSPGLGQGVQVGAGKSLPQPAWGGSFNLYFLKACASHPPFSQTNSQGAREEEEGLEPRSNREASLEATPPLGLPASSVPARRPTPFPTQITEGRHLSQHQPYA